MVEFLLSSFPLVPFGRVPPLDVFDQNEHPTLERSDPPKLFPLGRRQATLDHRIVRVVRASTEQTVSAA